MPTINWQDDGAKLADSVPALEQEIDEPGQQNERARKLVHVRDRNVPGGDGAQSNGECLKADAEPGQHRAEASDAERRRFKPCRWRDNE